MIRNCEKFQLQKKPNMKKKSKNKKNKKFQLPRSLRLKKNQPAVRLQTSSYNITYEPIGDSSFPKEVEGQCEELHNLSDKNPSQAIPRLKALKKKYPEVREFYNWLVAALAAVGEGEEAEQLAKECYQKFPDYLFAKLSYAEFCMRRGNFEEVPIILDHKFDLKMHLPERDTYHITEVVGFFGITGIYYARIGELEAARVCCDLLKEIAPEHQATLQLMHILAPSLFQKLLNSKAQFL